MDRRTNKKKLSKHLLEMKFMKRTREKTELQVDIIIMFFEREKSINQCCGAEIIS
jgi:hypothetical protein